jgi:1-acyl-sn-glycerol-3-phosphate acyltransferase
VPPARVVIRYALRRLLIIPLVLALTIAIAAILPVVAVGQGAAAAFIRLRGGQPRWRAVRLLAFAVLYGISECGAVLVCLLLWVASPLPRWRDDARWRERHVRVLGGFLGMLFRAAGPVFGFRMRLEHPRGGLAGPGRPLIVLSRHAGPGASFVLIYVLLRAHQRVPRIVLQERLRLDPALDLLLTRIGCAFLDAGRTGAGAPTALVGRLAADLRPGDAMVIFPEGMDWTPARHRLSVGRLRRKGLPGQAAAAEAMPNVLPPRPAGTFAALKAAPDAGLAVFMHTGHDALLGPAAIWQALPLRRELLMVCWNEPEPRASSEADCAAWLNEVWRRIDSWIQEQAAVTDLIEQNPAARRVI